MIQQNVSFFIYADILLNRILERGWEWRLGIDSRGTVKADQMGLRSDAVDYCPIPFRGFFQAMKQVPRELQTGTFIDYGSGKGRALVLAARYYNFRRVIGVEMSSDLCEQAKRNLRHASSGRVEIVCSDAAAYQPPSDATVFFLFNPFFGETMEMVVHNLRKSLAENPRRAAIVVCNPRNFKAAVGAQDWYEERAAGKVSPSLSWHVFITRAGSRDAEVA